MCLPVSSASLLAGSAVDDSYDGLADCNQVRAVCRNRIESRIKASQVDRAAGLRATGNGLTGAVGHGQGHALARSLCFLARD